MENSDRNLYDITAYDAAAKPKGPTVEPLRAEQKVALRGFLDGTLSKGDVMKKVGTKTPSALLNAVERYTASDSYL